MLRMPKKFFIVLSRRNECFGTFVLKFLVFICTNKKPCAIIRVLFGTADPCCTVGYTQSGKMKLVNKIRRKAILQKSEDVPRRISA